MTRSFNDRLPAAHQDLSELLAQHDPEGLNGTECFIFLDAAVLNRQCILAGLPPGARVTSKGGKSLPPEVWKLILDSAAAPSEAPELLLFRATLQVRAEGGVSLRCREVEALLRYYVGNWDMAPGTKPTARCEPGPGVDFEFAQWSPGWPAGAKSRPNSLAHPAQQARLGALVREPSRNEKVHFLLGYPKDHDLRVSVNIGQDELQGWYSRPCRFVGPGGPCRYLFCLHSDRYTVEP